MAYLRKYLIKRPQYPYHIQSIVITIIIFNSIDHNLFDLFQVILYQFIIKSS